MEVLIVPEHEIGELVADDVSGLIAERPDAVLGLATGSSPLRIYDALARRVSEGVLSLQQTKGFTLDEYVGLAEGHPCRYSTVIQSELVRRVDMPSDSVRGPDGGASNLHDECRSFENAIADVGGVDLQILGIGSDGHIAFNEPGSSLASRTRVKTLTEQTRRDNARFFGGDIDAVPRHCLTQGLGTISEARHIVLVATGQEKSEAVAQLVEGAVSARWPATVLQHHPRVTVYVDEAAASRLILADYYRYTHAHRRLVG